jgi:hypothetical protein
VVVLCFVKEKPLATTIERDIVPTTLEVDGANSVQTTTDDLDAELEALEEGEPASAQAGFKRPAQ